MKIISLKFKKHLNYNILKKHKKYKIYKRKTCIKYVKSITEMKKLICNNDITCQNNKLDMAIYTNNKEIIASYSKDIVNIRMNKINLYKEKLKKLQEYPLIKQRTDEWYELRKNRLTASDLEDAIKDNNIAIAKKKAGILKDTTNYNGVPALKWGVMFEPMATRCYSQANYNIGISEFGLIPDKKLEHFGASPDGINDLGIMIEIKCPYSRVIIDGGISDKYYMQIQGQLAVCELEECDFIECKFETHESVYKYIEMFNDTDVNHGVIAEYKNKTTGEFVYLYSDIGLRASSAYDNINKQIFTMNNENNDNLVFIKITSWNLSKMNVQRISFDQELWDNTIPKINRFWNKVEECKLLPTEQPVKKKNKYVFIEDND